MTVVKGDEVTTLPVFYSLPYIIRLSRAVQFNHDCILYVFVINIILICMYNKYSVWYFTSGLWVKEVVPLSRSGIEFLKTAYSRK